MLVRTFNFCHLKIEHNKFYVILTRFGTNKTVQLLIATVCDLGGPCPFSVAWERSVVTVNAIMTAAVGSFIPTHGATVLLYIRKTRPCNIQRIFEL